METRCVEISAVSPNALEAEISVSLNWEKGYGFNGQAKFRRRDNCVGRGGTTQIDLPDAPDGSLSMKSSPNEKQPCLLTVVPSKHDTAASELVSDFAQWLDEQLLELERRFADFETFSSMLGGIRSEKT